MSRSETQAMVEEIAIEVIASDDATLPHYASLGAAGADVRAYLSEALVIPAGEVALVPTGLKFAIPDGYEIQVRPRSGLAAKSKVTVLNSPGTIDSDYRGEVKVILINHGHEPFTVEPGMRIAQLVVAPVVKAFFAPAKELSETIRGVNGFGHTGVK